MNQTLEHLINRKSIRAYEERPIEAEVKAQILHATLRAPTAGNMMLYSIVDVTDQKIRDRLAVTCDNQPFVVRAPMVWMFLAGYQPLVRLFHRLECGRVLLAKKDADTQTRGG